MSDVNTGIWSDKRIIKILLRILDKNFYSELGESVRKKEGTNSQEEQVVLHPSILTYRQQTRI